MNVSWTLTHVQIELQPAVQTLSVVTYAHACQDSVEMEKVVKVLHIILNFN